MITKKHERRGLKTICDKPNAPTCGRNFELFYLMIMVLYFTFNPAPPALWANDYDFVYTASINGISINEIQSLLKDTSNTITLQDKPVISLSVLRRRINQDIPRMITILRSRGFYSAQVTNEIKTDETPVQVLFKIDLGPPYLIKQLDIHIHGEGETLKNSLSFKDDAGLELDTRAETKQILKAQERLEHWFKARGFPFARMDHPNIIVDHSNQSVSVTYIIYSGVKADFGLTRIKGLETVEESFIRSKIPWKEGDLFSIDFFTEAKNNLNALGLFATIDVKEEETLDENGRLPVLITVLERKHHTIKTGVGYATDEGVSGKASWEHRNILHRGERLTISGVASEIAYSTEAMFHKPQFQRPDQALILNLRLAEEYPEAYTSRNLTSLVKIERSLSDEVILGVGVGDRMSRVEQLGRIERFNLLSLPLNLDWNTRNDLLNPIQGGYLNAQIEPYYDTYGSDLRFTKGLLSYQRYFHVSSNPNFILAMRGSIGAMEGAERDDIPADIRFYAGGGGSIRGYPYQSVGPVQDGIPIGGRSLFGLSTELRTKISEPFGLVFFIDGGNAFETAMPDVDQSLYWGTGIGLRYFTAIGPLRMDVGFPLTRRESMDDSFQIYVSIGQAF